MTSSTIKKGSTTTPVSRDAEATKNRILNAAEEEFAKAGLAGARTEAIAANTGVTKAMLYYYYQSKELLYQAVLERAFAKRIKAIQNLDLQSAPADKTMRLYLDSFLDEVGTNTNMPLIMFYEAVQNQGKYYKQIAISAMYQPLAAIVERGVKSKVFRKVDSLHATVNIIGLCVFYFCSRENVKHLWPAGAQLLGPEMLRKHKEEAISFVLAGLKA